MGPCRVSMKVVIFLMLENSADVRCENTPLPKVICRDYLRAISKLGLVQGETKGKREKKRYHTVGPLLLTTSTIEPGPVPATVETLPRLCSHRFSSPLPVPMPMPLFRRRHLRSRFRGSPHSCLALALAHLECTPASSTWSIFDGTEIGTIRISYLGYRPEASVSRTRIHVHWLAELTMTCPSPEKRAAAAAAAVVVVAVCWNDFELCSGGKHRNFRHAPTATHRTSCRRRPILARVGRFHAETPSLSEPVRHRPVKVQTRTCGDFEQPQDPI